jgi:hypothetical protein
MNKSTIWEDENFPCRLKVKPIIELTPETAVPVFELRDQLSCFKISDSPYAWTGRFRGSPSKWSKSDGEAIIAALKDAQENPVKRPFDPKKLARRPKSLESKKYGPVTIPETDSDQPSKNDFQEKSASEHTEIQSILLKLGSDMGFDVWVARNDRNKAFDGKKFADLPKLKNELPLQFDDATNKTIEHIDVLWLKGNAIVSAFEIEHTTSIYSGLLRMSDLISMQPNINIPLYLVAPDDRRNKAVAEINRPTFAKLNPALSQICRFVSFDTLRSELEKIRHVVKYLKAEYLEEISESCEAE